MYDLDAVNDPDKFASKRNWKETESFREYMKLSNMEPQTKYPKHPRGDL